MTEEAVDPIRATWDGDHLNRVEVARFLTTYLNSIYVEDNPELSAGHFVLNLNATWGHGKTFLLKNWADDLSKAEYPVVIFDAWENDFSKDPLIGFMSELYDALDPWLKDIAPAKAAMKKVKKSVTKVISAGVGILAGGAAAGLTEAGLNMLTGGLDVSGSTTDAIAGRIGENAGKLAEMALEEHKATKQAICEFKENLEALIKAIEGNTKGKKLPLYIFIDELDRCRPTYAIELLENIKHLFGVKGVFFVVATNKEQLCHSIKAVYGDSFDASGYLGRFFDQEYTLPEPNNKRYAKYLLDRYDITSDERLFSPIEKKKDTKDHITDLFALFADAFKLPLRDQGQIVRRLKAILMVYEKTPIYFDYLIFLLMLHKASESAFKEVLALDLNFSSVSSEQILKNIFDGRKTIEIHSNKVVGGRTQRPLTETSLLKLMSFYISWSHKSRNEAIKELSDLPTTTRLSNATLNEAISMTSDYLSFSQYPSLVKQVGHLEA